MIISALLNNNVTLAQKVVSQKYMYYRRNFLNAHNQLLSSSVRIPFRKVGHNSNLSIDYYTPKVFGFFISERGIIYVMYDISIQASGSFHLHPHKINCTLHTGFEQSRCFEGSCRSRERKICNDQIIPR